MSRGHAEPFSEEHKGSITPSRLRPLDVGREAWISTFRRPGRMILTALGTILGVGTIVATTGIVSTANQQVTSKFNAIESTQVTVTDNGTSDVPLDSESNALRIKGVKSAGIAWQVTNSAEVSTDPDPSLAQSFSQDLPLYAATPAGLAVTGALVVTGRLYDQGDEQRSNRVVLVGTIAARALDISSVANTPAIFIDGTAFTVVGIVSGLERMGGGVAGIVIPATTAQSLVPPAQAQSSSARQSAQPPTSSDGSGNSSNQPTLYVTTTPGAAGVVSGEIAYAVNPAQTGQLSVSTPPDPSTLRRQVEGATSSLLLLLAGLSLLIGVVAIANTTLLAVLERIPEIGLRRALGARPRHIGIVVLIEAGLVGGVGGLIGAAVGVIVVASVAVAETWTAVLDPRIALAAPFIGIAAGFLAGAYPAWRTTRIEPVSALQR